MFTGNLHLNKKAEIKAERMERSHTLSVDIIDGDGAMVTLYFEDKEALNRMFEVIGEFANQ